MKKYLHKPAWTGTFLDMFTLCAMGLLQPARRK